MPKRYLFELWQDFPEHFPKLSEDTLARVPKLSKSYGVPVQLAERIGKGASVDKRRLAVLYHAQQGKCFWCERETLLPFDEGYFRPANKGAVSGKAATVDHLYSKLSPHRHRTPKIRNLIVMACFTCNNRRSREECLLIARLLKLRRSRPKVAVCEERAGAV